MVRFPRSRSRCSIDPSADAIARSSARIKAGTSAAPTVVTTVGADMVVRSRDTSATPGSSTETNSTGLRIMAIHSRAVHNRAVHNRAVRNMEVRGPAERVSAAASTDAEGAIGMPVAPISEPTGCVTT